MHAGFLDVDTLRQVESAIWGDTKRGGAVRVMLERVDTVEPKAYEKASRANMGPEHKVSAYGVPGADPRKTTQGLWYTSYGMDKRDKRRWYLETGGSWRIRLTARGLDPATTPQVVLEQAKAALWLLCNYGGVGSKARKGFGSLTAADFDGWGLADCQRAAAELREQIGLPNRHQDGLAESSSLQQSLGVCEVPFHWPDVWHVLDQIGFAYQAFSQRYKHRLEKKALGLPRRVGRPCSGHFRVRAGQETLRRRTQPASRRKCPTRFPHSHPRLSRGKWIPCSRFGVSRSVPAESGDEPRILAGVLGLC